MALTKQDVYQVEITEGDHVQVRRKTLILEDGVEISSSLHRHVISPGEDASAEPKKVQRAVAAAHVPTVVNLYQSKQAERAAQDALQQAEADYKADSKAANNTAKDKAKAAATAAKTARDEAQAASDKFEAA